VAEIDSPRRFLPPTGDNACTSTASVDLEDGAVEAVAADGCFGVESFVHRSAMTSETLAELCSCFDAQGCKAAANVAAGIDKWNVLLM